MFKDVKEVKQFILWCKKNKLKSFKINDIEFEISELSFISDNEVSEAKPADLDKTFVDDEKLSKQEENDLLYWSTTR